MRNLSKLSLIASTLLVSTALSARAEMNVVTSIKPVHSIVSGVMEGVGQPELLITGANSPHNFAMKPSHARSLQEADIVFWIGHGLETFLEKPLETVASGAQSVELIEVDGVKALEYESDDHDDHQDHDDHDEHKDHDDHDDHKDHDDHDDHKGHDDHDDHDGHEAAGHEGHNHGSIDPHIWLDPENVKAVALYVANVLAEKDAGNAEIYKANAEKMSVRLDELTNSISEKLEPVKGRKFVTFHDGFGYFERRFGVEAAGFINPTAEKVSGAEHLREIREDIAAQSITCLFSEPQFSTKLVDTVTEGMEMKVSVLDPLGANIDDGSDLYFMMMENLASSVAECLSD